MLKAQKVLSLIKSLTEGLIVNNRVKDKESGKMGVIASISSEGQVTVKWDDGTEAMAAPDTLEKVEGEEPMPKSSEPAPVVEPSPAERLLRKIK